MLLWFVWITSPHDTFVRMGPHCVTLALLAHGFISGLVKWLERAKPEGQVGNIGDECVSVHLRRLTTMTSTSRDKNSKQCTREAMTQS